MKKATSVLLILMFLLTIVYPTISTAEWISNGIMRYRLDGWRGFRIEGQINGEWQQTTWGTNPYETFIQVENGDVVQVEYSDWR